MIFKNILFLIKKTPCNVTNKIWILLYCEVQLELSKNLNQKSPLFPLLTVVVSIVYREKYLMSCSNWNKNKRISLDSSSPNVMSTVRRSRVKPNQASWRAKGKWKPGSTQGYANLKRRRKLCLWKRPRSAFCISFVFWLLKHIKGPRIKQLSNYD